MESWSNTTVGIGSDSYIQWIEYSLLMNVREMASLHNGCTMRADWLETIAGQWIKVALKQIDDTQSHDFYQVKIISHANC